MYIGYKPQLLESDSTLQGYAHNSIKNPGPKREKEKERENKNTSICTLMFRCAKTEAVAEMQRSTPTLLAGVRTLLRLLVRWRHQVVISAKLLMTKIKKKKNNMLNLNHTHESTNWVNACANKMPPTMIALTILEKFTNRAV